MIDPCYALQSDAPLTTRVCSCLGRSTLILFHTEKSLDNLTCRVAVAIWVVVDLPLGVLVLVEHQATRGFDDGRLVGADKLDGSGVDRFGAFRRIARHQNRLLERGSFFLHAARVGDDDLAPIHQPDEFGVGRRCRQVNIRRGAEQVMHRPFDIGIEMNRVDPLCFWKTRREFRNG